MTYFAVLAVFVLPLMAVLLALAILTITRRPGKNNRVVWLVLAGHVLLALLYTTPWDNYLVATRVWWYNPELVSGIVFGWVPVEEYLFFVVQTVLVGSWTLLLRHWLRDDRGKIIHPRWQRNLWSGLLIIFWILAAQVLGSGWAPGTYLALIVVWALIPLLVQSLFGADILAARWRVLLPGSLAPTIYLWLVDAFAIRSGTWTIDPAQSTGLGVAGLPVEEMLFFFLTNLIVTAGILLMLAPESHSRARAWLQRVKAALMARREGLV